MHLSTLARGLALCGVSAAFPSLSPEIASLASHVGRSTDAHEFEERDVAFDPSTQLVDVTGVHAWKAPNFAAGDQRGPCPGLNALAYAAPPVGRWLGLG